MIRNRLVLWLIFLMGAILSGIAFADQPADEDVIAAQAGAFAELDNEIERLMAKHDLPGISIAISDHGKLIHSRGYGYANRETGERVSPASRFRIASISKPITAVAVLRLIEMGKLKLDDRVFEILDAPKPLEDAAPADKRLMDITIEHLLQHRGGWDRDQSFDPMFQSVRFAKLCDCDPPASQAEVIRAMQAQSLDFDPGSRYAYSNYGYCLLGRVIEKLSGQSYEEFVRTQILKPLDIQSLTIGKTRLEDRQDQEVHYYHPENGKSVFASDLGQSVASPYGNWFLEAMDSHGGWIATAEDLVRFIDAIPFSAENVEGRVGPLVLKPESVAAMLAKPTGISDDGREKSDHYYGLGWTIRPGKLQSPTVWHTGSLPGTASELTRRSDGRCFAVLINSRSGSGGKNPLNEVTGAVHRAIAGFGDDNVLDQDR